MTLIVFHKAPPITIAVDHIPIVNPHNPEIVETHRDLSLVIMSRPLIKSYFKIL